MMNGPQLVTFGEAMVRLTPSGSRRLEQAVAFDAHVGGGELNTAVAASRLGLSSRWISRLPDNPLGRLIAGRAREHGVDTSAVVWATGERAGLYFAEMGAAPRASAVIYDRADSAMHHIRPGDVPWPVVLDGAQWFHTTGITPALSPSAAETVAEALRAAKDAGLTVSYDLNYRAKLWSPDRARAVQAALMRFVDVLITTEEDARVVFGVGTAPADDYRAVDAATYRDVASALQERFGFKAVAVTLRQNPRVWLNTWSAMLVAGGEVYEAPQYEVEIVDRIGAGDSFAGGLITAMLRTGDWAHALRYGTALSAIKHGIPGDFCISAPDEVDRVLGGGSLRVAR